MRCYRIRVKILFLLILCLEVSDMFAQQVCIIGAGYSGLATARYMKDYGLNYTVFEVTRYIGGNWRFDPNVGIDEDGLPLFTRQYKNLRTNTPYVTMEFAGFPFPEGSSTYPSGDCFYKYIKAFAKHFNLLKNIKFRSQVTEVRWTGDRFKITYLKTDTRQYITVECGFIVVAIGNLHLPNIPLIKGQETFRGRMLHIQDYKDAEDFRDQRVLLVGAGPSGLDLGKQLVNVSSMVIHSHHGNYSERLFDDIDNYVKKPDLHSFTPSGAVFKDGSTECFDVVIFCTGYNYFHPFLKHRSNGLTLTNKNVMPLYQHIVNINNPAMAFVGTAKYVMTTLRDAQAEYSAALAAGRFKLPSKEQMLRVWLDSVEKLKKKNKIINLNSLGLSNMAEYLYALHKEAGITLVPPVISNLAAFDGDHFYYNSLNFRDYDYKIVSDKKFERIYNPKKEICLIDE